MKGKLARLDNDRRKALRQLADLGFRVEAGRGDYKMVSPEGVPMGRFTISGKHARVTPGSLHARFREWQEKRGRFAPA